ncbi:hypothetical protein INH39_25780 [Massilia violaceinigra]|uniref:DUF4365 domain-containing protein n=1 Tax=Massilia violaceinigra TaxID=2045208 RepID=A0ABY4A354_9BURK|nr:hypothetical protein [Massilia violaceinigra]UOD28822.1 hypothetical protein INH39_25780 [Massilia violaceinigra]
MMSNVAYLFGKAGEFLCGGELLRPLSGSRYLFDVYFLGGNAPTFDYIVYLLDEGGRRTGHFFFLQVKTTARTARSRTGYPIRFSAADIRRAQATKVPFFICVVDCSAGRRAKFFIKGLESTRTRAIATLSPDHDLETDAVKLDLYREVTRLWARRRVPALKRLI